MKKISNINYDKLKKMIRARENIFIKGKKKWSDIIFTLDTEATSYYFGEDYKVHVFEDNDDAELYKDKKKQSEMYIWMIGINDEYYYGRTLKEMYNFFQRLSFIAGDVLLVFYIHNLSYDLEFIFDALGTTNWEIFAREKNKPIKAYNKFYGVEFRCSLFLTNQSLEEVAKSRGFEAQKQVGLLKYNVLRSPYTYLNEDELKYCEYDLRVLYELLREEKGIYKSVYNIPLTQTGKVRRHIRILFYKDKDYKDKLKDNVIPTSLEEYKMLEKVYAGGYTHANYKHANKLLKDVYSMDITSSYPTIITTKKMPYQRFRDALTVDYNSINKDLYACIIDVTFRNIDAKTSNSFLSYNKIYTPNLDKTEDKKEKLKIKKDLAKGVLVDNGRIRHADKVRFLLCDVDFETVLNNYKTKDGEVDYQINKIYIAAKKYLDIKIIKYVLDLFAKKTQFKDVDGKEIEYREAKEFINSIYGLFCCKFLINPIEFNEKDGSYNTIKLTDSMAQSMIDDTFEKTQILSWAWGVWTAAYARRHLWKLIEVIGDDVVYSDTDSIKFLNYKKYLKYFEEDNKDIDRQIDAVCKYYQKEGLSPDMYKAVSPKGKVCHLGYFDFDDYYYEFKTLGAKKYCYTHKNKKGDIELGITVAGLSKKAAKYIKSVDDFKVGLYFDSTQSGRTVAYYNDNQIGVAFPDGWVTQCKHGICIMPSTYLLGITPEYSSLIESADIMEI